MQALNVIVDILSLPSPPLSSLRTPRIAFILFAVLASLLRHKVVPHVHRIPEHLVRVGGTREAIAIKVNRCRGRDRDRDRGR